MTAFTEVLEAVNLVGEALQSIAEIRAAVREGKDYLRAKHREVEAPLRAMLDELRKTSSAIAEASGALRAFQFSAAREGDVTELARFNEHVIEHAKRSTALEQQIDALRGHCSVIDAAATEIMVRAFAPRDFAAVFGLLGLASPKREQELGHKLYDLANEEHRSMNAAVRMVEALSKALRDVQETLLTDGLARTENIPEAAKRLARYAAEFAKVERDAREQAAEIRVLLDELR